MTKFYPSSVSHATKLDRDDEPASAVQPIYADTDARLILVEAFDVCPPVQVARRLAVSEDLVRGWRRGKSYPNLDQLCRAPERFVERISALLGAHAAASVRRPDPQEALHLALLSLGSLLVEIDRKPLGERTPEELKKVRDEAADLARLAAGISRDAAEQLRTVEGGVSK